MAGCGNLFLQTPGHGRLNVVPPQGKFNLVPVFLSPFGDIYCYMLSKKPKFPLQGSGNFLDPLTRYQTITGPPSAWSKWNVVPLNILGPPSHKSRSSLQGSGNFLDPLNRYQALNYCPLVHGQNKMWSPWISSVPPSHTSDVNSEHSLYDKF